MFNQQICKLIQISPSACIVEGGREGDNIVEGGREGDNIVERGREGGRWHKFNIC